MYRTSFVALIAATLLTQACDLVPEPDPPLQLGLLGGEPAYPLGKLDFTLNDTDGRPYDFRAETDGVLTLLFFGYTSCPDICPIHMATLAQALAELPPEQREKITVVFVTVDPERDSPVQIRAWLDAFDESFVGLRGSLDEVGAVLAQYNYPPPERESGGAGYLMSHPATVYAFTPDNLGRGMYGGGTTKATWVHDLGAMLGYPWDTQPLELPVPEEIPQGEFLGQAGDIQVFDGYAPAPAGDSPAAVYVRFVNRGTAPDTLLALASEAAAAGSIHAMLVEGGVTRMVPMDRVEIPAGASVQFEPGGRHGMLEGLNRLLIVGSRVQVEFSFARGGPVRVPVKVVSFTAVVR
jgi:protein SCO1/2